MSLSDFCAIEGCLNARADAPAINAVVDTVEGLTEVGLYMCRPHRDCIVVISQDEHRPPPRLGTHLMHSAS